MNLFEALLSEVEADPENWDLRLQVAETLSDAGKKAEAISLLGSGPVGQGVTQEVAARIQALTGLNLVVAEPIAVDSQTALRREPELSPEEGVLKVEEEETRLPDAPEKAKRYFQISDQPADWVPKAGRPAETRDKISSVMVAVLVHVGLLVLGGLVTLALPLTEPPQIVAAVAPQAEEDQIEKKQVKKVRRQPPASAAPNAMTVVTPHVVSPVSLVSMPSANPVDVTIGLSGMGEAFELGVSYESGGEESHVNFFGIKSSAKRMVFIIDAERYMLTDTKGGMPAYDKVKEEVSRLLDTLNSSTAFNLLIFEGGKVRNYAEELVPAQPSHVRRAAEWLLPVNTDYAALGLRNDYNRDLKVEDTGKTEIPGNRVSGYVKAIQLALQMDAHAVFVISSGWRSMGSRPATEKQIAAAKERREAWNASDGPEKWNQAMAKARAWLKKENEARRKQGIAQKVVISLTGMARKLSPGVPLPPGGASGPAYTQEDAVENIKGTVEKFYLADKKPKPRVNFVLFLGEDEDNFRYEDHYKMLTRRNKGKLKVLKGLGALQNVSGG